MKVYRDSGAKGALLDEYEKAINELLDLISPISNEDLKKIVDTVTSDEDCRSIQTILSHVVSSGYGYAIYIQNHQGLSVPFRQKETLNDVQAYKKAIYEMFEYTETVFDDFPSLVLEEYAQLKKIKTRWGQVFDVDQLMEHAIVHILRHRRQIERFLIRIKNLHN